MTKSAKALRERLRTHETEVFRRVIFVCRLFMAEMKRTNKSMECIIILWKRSGAVVTAVVLVAVML